MLLELVLFKHLGVNVHQTLVKLLSPISKRKGASEIPQSGQVKGPLSQTNYNDYWKSFSKVSSSKISLVETKASLPRSPLPCLRRLEIFCVKTFSIYFENILARLLLSYSVF